MEVLIPLLLDKNNSPAWNRIKNILNIWNMSKGTNAKTTALNKGE